jgi:hypothetical protein
MKIINLIIKQKFFDEIMAGTKVFEYREIRPQNVSKYLQLDKDGYEVEDKDANAVPVKYDAIRFYVGYNKERDSALVEVKDAHCEIFVDDKKKPIMYKFNNQDWVAEQVVYHLGQILEKNIHDKAKK